MSVVYVLTTPILEDSGDDATVEQIKKMNKWDNNDHVCRGLILKGNKKYFVTFIDDDSRFCYVSLLHTKDEALDKLKAFKTKVKLHQRFLIKRFRTDMEVTRDEASDQHSYCFNVEDDPKTFDEAMKSHDVASWKEAINDEMESIMGNNTCKFDESGKGVIISLYVDDMLIFGIDQVLKKFNYFDCTLVSTPIDTREKLMPNNGQAISQLEYSRVIGCLMYAMTCTRPDIAFAVGKLSKYTSNPGTQHWQAFQRVLKYLKKTMDYRLTCTGYPLVLEVANKEAEWLKNLPFEILLWSKPIAPIYIRCDSTATLAKAYSQVYNGKSRHLGVRHNMIRELITNGVISIKFVRS
nr:hypothetical protein [Tanacetum cinerariifolium]